MSAVQTLGEVEIEKRRRVRDIATIAALIMLVTCGLAVMYWPLIRDPADMKFIGYMDAWSYTAPGFYFVDRVEHEGELPLWNPLVFCGQPLAGNPQYCVFYPPNVVRTWLTPRPTPWKTSVGIFLLVYLHVLWAAIGAFLFGRAHHASRIGACVAAAVYVFSAAYTQRLFVHHQVLMVVSWTPILFFLLRKAMDARTTRESSGWFILLGAAYGMQILAGSPQIAFLAGFALAIYWLLTRGQDVVMAFARRVLTRETLLATARDLALGVVAAGLSLAVAAALLVPAEGFVREASRMSNGGTKIDLGPSVDTWPLVDLLSVYLGSNIFESVKATGASALLLAAVGLFSVRRREAFLFGVLSLLLLDASLPTSRFMLPFFSAIAPFPMSAPGRMMMMGVLPLAMLAGHGTDYLLAPTGSRTRRVLAASALLALGVYMTQSLYMRLSGDPAEMPVRIPIAVAVFPAATLAIVLAGVAWPLKYLPAIAAAALALAEPVCWRALWSANLASSPAYFYNNGDTMTSHRDFTLDNSRDSFAAPNSAEFTLTAQINGYDPLQLRGIRDLIGPAGSDGFWRGLVESTRSSAAPYTLLKRTFWLEREYAVGGLPDRMTMYPATTTALLSDPPPLHVPEVPREQVSSHPYSDNVQRLPVTPAEHEFLPGHGVEGPSVRLSLPAHDPHRHLSLHFRIAGNCAAEIEVRMPESADRNASQLAALIKISKSDAQPRDIDVPLPDSALTYIDVQPFYLREGDRLTMDRAELIVDANDEDDRIKILHRSANSIEVELRDLPAYRIFSFIDFAYPGWHAYLDGHEVTLLRAFTYFKAVEVPPGTHRVRFEFRQPSVYAGIATSVAALAVCAVLFAWALRRRRS